MKLITLDSFQYSNVPQVCVSDDMRGLVSWLIKYQHSGGNYCHVMEVFHDWKLLEVRFASQGWTGYKSIPMSSYNKPQLRLKFFRRKNLSEIERVKWLSIINNEIAKPWYKHRYDFPGLIGQATGLRFINLPYAYYCSEIVDLHLKQVFSDWKCKEKPNPSDINSAMMSDTIHWECSGYVIKE